MDSLSHFIKDPLIQYVINTAHTEDMLCKVLLVEDDPVTRWMVRSELKSLCHLSTADCATIAIKRFIEWNPDFVILDIGLPDRDGREVLDWILNRNPNAHVTMLSCHCDPDIISRTMEQGAKGFIAKPFDKKSLFRSIGIISDE